MAQFEIRPFVDADRDWAKQRLVRFWNDETVIAHGVVYYPAELPGFVGIYEGKPAALATYLVEGDGCELVSLDSDVEGMGIGTALITEVIQAARNLGCRRIWLITTNDNLHALGFYQKRGFHLVAVHPGAVDQARKQKPSIPLIGANGIPIRDELVLEMEI